MNDESQPLNNDASQASYQSQSNSAQANNNKRKRNRNKKGGRGNGGAQQAAQEESKDGHAA